MPDQNVEPVGWFNLDIEKPAHVGDLEVWCRMHPPVYVAPGCDTSDTAYRVHWKRLPGAPVTVHARTPGQAKGRLFRELWDAVQPVRYVDLRARLSPA